MGGLKAIKDTGRRVPHDIAVTGFGNYELAQFVEPNLSSVFYDMHQMGRIAARRLAMLLDEPDEENWHILAPTSLVVRESSEF